MRRPDWGHGPNKPVLVFTEDEIRHVMEVHYPSTSYGGADASDCACGPQTVRRNRCFYCAALVPEDWRETEHRRGCKAAASGFRDMGVTMASYPEFTADHLIEELRNARDRAIAAEPRARSAANQS